jgi:hypothetical protein
VGLIEEESEVPLSSLGGFVDRLFLVDLKEFALGLSERSEDESETAVETIFEETTGSSLNAESKTEDMIAMSIQRHSPPD